MIFAFVLGALIAEDLTVYQANRLLHSQRNELSKHAKRKRRAPCRNRDLIGWKLNPRRIVREAKEQE